MVEDHVEPLACREVTKRTSIGIEVPSKHGWPSFRAY